MSCLLWGEDKMQLCFKISGQKQAQKFSWEKCSYETLKSTGEYWHDG